jgi:nucleotide-binding universal stress UspA family protein
MSGMSYSTIMVHQSLDETNDSRLPIAVDLARRFNAKLIGIAACAIRPSAYGGGVFMDSIVSELRPITQKRLNEAAARFRSGSEGKARTTEWRQALAKPTTYVAEQARAADLIITGAARDGVYLDPLTELDPGELIMEAGRPVLIVPPEANQLAARHVVVAWKDTREARRAILDSLPLLQMATDVTVVEIAERTEITTATRSGEDVAEWLNRHGVCAGANALTAHDEPFNALEALLLQNAADLIVAGAYGHNRVQEWIFGGVTRDLLMKSRCCCLFSN